MSLKFVLPYYEGRDAVEFVPELSSAQANHTLTSTEESNLSMGSDVVYNDPTVQEMEFIVNGRDGSQTMLITG